MVYIACVALVVAYILIYVLLRDRASERAGFIAALERASAQPSAEIQALIELTDRLCQRVQAPQAAVVEHHDTTLLPSYPAVTPDDDASHWVAQEISKDALAELAMEQELAGRGGVPAG